MANQTEPGAAVAQPQGLLADVAAAGSPGQYDHVAFHGRPVSWVAVSVIIAGFLMGGLALIFGPTWWAFWTGAGLAAAGGLLSVACNMFEDWY